MKSLLELRKNLNPTLSLYPSRITPSLIYRCWSFFLQVPSLPVAASKYKIVSSSDDYRKKLELSELPNSFEVVTIFTFAALERASSMVITSIFPVERTKTNMKSGYFSGLSENSLTDGRLDRRQLCDALLF